MLQHLNVVLKHGLGLFFREILDNFKGHFVVIALIVSVNVMCSNDIFNECHSWVLFVSIYVDLSHFDIVWYLEFLISDLILALNQFNSSGGGFGLLMLAEILNDGQSGFTVVNRIFNIHFFNSFLHQRYS